MDSSLLSLAFTTGMVVTVNPCGFAMLPAYLSFFVGVDDARDRDLAASVARSLVVATSVTAGFVATFAVMGLIVHQLTDRVYSVAPWIAVVVGVGLALLGVALVLGREVSVRLPHLDRGGRSGGVGSMFVFGVSYAVASCGCTLPLFLATMLGVFNRGVGSAVGYFAAYAFGFWLVLTTVTMGVALARQSILRGVRRTFPLMNRIAGALLILTGGYVAWYGRYEIGGRGNDGTVTRVTGWSSDVATWVQQNGAVEIGLILLVLVVGAASYAFLVRRWDGPPSTGSRSATGGRSGTGSVELSGDGVDRGVEFAGVAQGTGDPASDDA